MNAQHLSLSQEHYTPKWIVEKCREVMGEITLDPASNAIANSIVKADRYYTKEDDSLTQDWSGWVFLNPPGGKTNNKSNMKLFAQKLICEYSLGELHEAFFLAFSTSIFRLCPEITDYPFCVFSERVKYLDENLQPQKSPTHDSVIFYLGHQREKFKKTFSDCGQVIWNRDKTQW